MEVVIVRHVEVLERYMTMVLQVPYQKRSILIIAVCAMAEDVVAFAMVKVIIKKMWNVRSRKRHCEMMW